MGTGVVCLEWVLVLCVWNGLTGVGVVFFLMFCVYFCLDNTRLGNTLLLYSTLPELMTVGDSLLCGFLRKPWIVPDRYHISG